jgi:hypothetical protein
MKDLYISHTIRFPLFLHVAGFVFWVELGKQSCQVTVVSTLLYRAFRECFVSSFSLFMRSLFRSFVSASRWSKRGPGISSSVSEGSVRGDETMEGRSMCLLWIRNISSVPLERLVLPATIAVTSADSTKYDLASRTGGKVVTYVPTNHVYIHCTMPSGYITVATAYGTEVRWPRWCVLRAFSVDHVQGAISVLPEYTHEYLLVHSSRQIASCCA